jgi:prolyl-tRNA editing enzyme YbaK/EbsC (Cys-tRNA(Pro) deacylase)
MWPEPVERIASFLRESEAVGRIEELAPGVELPPEPAASATAFDCDGSPLVVLVPDDREVNRERVARQGGCSRLKSAASQPFPFQGARVFLDRSLLSEQTIWLEAGSPRHVLGLAPSQLLRLTRAETGSFLLED